MQHELVPDFVPHKKGCVAYDVCQLIAQGGWFSPGTPATLASKTDHCDMTEIFKPQSNKHKIRPLENHN